MPKGRMGGVEELGRAAHTSYVAHLGWPEVFGEMLWAEAWKRGWERAVESKVIGDGAAWIWNLAEEHFYGSHQAGVALVRNGCCLSERP